MFELCVVSDYFSPTMLGLKMDQEVLGELVRAKIPKMWQIMADHNVSWTLVVSRWFICLYIDVLPVEVSVSVCFDSGATQQVQQLLFLYLVSRVDIFGFR